MNLIIRHYSEEYEVIRAGVEPSSSCSELHNFNFGAARQFISNVNVTHDAWRSILMQLGISIPANFHNAYDILNAIASLCERNALRLFKIPKLENFQALPCGKSMGISFIKGPKPLINSIYKSLVITNEQDAKNLVESLTASDKEIMNCLAANGLLKQFSSTGDSRKILIDSLVAKKILAYRVPVYASTPPKKPEELIPATGPGYDKVPLAPESKPISKKTENKKLQPKSLDDCEQKLTEARKNLDNHGYKPKYTDEQQLEKVKSNSVASERFLVSFQAQNANPTAKLAFQRESGLAPIWSTSFDQLEYADTDPELIAKVLGTTYEPKKNYVLHIVDRGEDLSAFGQNTIVPTWDNMQEPVQQYLGGKHDPEILVEVMTPEYQQKYAKDIEFVHSAELSEFKDTDIELFSNTLSKQNQELFLARHNVRTEIGVNSEFTGNGLTRSRESGSQYGVVETLTLENNPPPVSEMKNIKTLTLNSRGII
jgi:hypothetical protein